MKVFFALVLIALTGAAQASHLWVNNITVNEYNMTWGYTETFTDADSIAYRISIDSELGNNDSFIGAWELLKADKETRKMLRESIGREPDVRINNETVGVEVIEVDSNLSPDLIGRTHLMDAAVNRYNVTYRFKDSILNASSIWFLGQPNTSVTIVMPAGVDVINVSGMYNVTKNITDHAEITGFFMGISRERGEINLSLTKNASFQAAGISSTLPASTATADNATKPAAAMISKIKNTSVIMAGIAVILLIYFFKLKRR